MVVLGISSGQYGGVGSGGQRDVRVGAGEGGSVAGYGVEVGSEAASRTEEADAIGAGGVDGDEDDVGMTLLRIGDRVFRASLSGCGLMRWTLLAESRRSHSKKQPNQAK